MSSVKVTRDYYLSFQLCLLHQLTPFLMQLTLLDRNKNGLCSLNRGSVTNQSFTYLYLLSFLTGNRPGIITGGSFAGF